MGNGSAKEENGEETLLEDSSSPAGNAERHWDGEAVSRGERGERSFPLAFSRRKSWLAVVSRTVAAKGKSPGRGEEATRR